MNELNQIFKKPRFLSIMSMLTAVLWITCVVSQNRLVSLSTVGYTCAAVIPYPFLCIIFDMIAEIYGYKESRKTLWLAFFSVWLFVLTVYFFTRLPIPTLLSSHSESFNMVMSPLLRILTFNSLAFVLGQYINIYIFSKMRIYFGGRFFGLRSIASTFIGDSITFAISLYGDFAGLIKNHTIFILVIDELIFMYALAIILALPASIIVRLLKKIEPEFNQGISFNPFK